MMVSSSGPMDRAVQKAANIIAKRARSLATDSKKTGSRKKQSAKSKAIWTGKLRTLIRTKLLKHETNSFAIIGPKSPEGNMAHFMQEKPRKHVLWGNLKNIRQYRIERNWITQSLDETKSEQLAAMTESLKADIDENMRHR